MLNQESEESEEIVEPYQFKPKLGLVKSLLLAPKVMVTQ